jgi:hypothetical protein
MSHLLWMLDLERTRRQRRQHDESHRRDRPDPDCPFCEPLIDNLWDVPQPGDLHYRPFGWM